MTDQGAAANGSTGTSDQSLVPDLSPREVAETHYRAVCAGNRELWVATLVARSRQMAGRRGGTPEFWWDAGRRYATEFGVTYHFEREDQMQADYCKLFFQRRHPDGSPRGRPVPIHLVREDGAWRVQTPSY